MTADLDAAPTAAFDPVDLALDPLAVGTRLSNKQWVAALVRSRPGTTRGDLVHSTDLSKSAVVNLVNELIEDGLLAEDEAASASRTGSGRRAARLFPVAPHVSIAALVLAHDRVEALVTDMAATPLARTTAAADLTSSSDDVLDLAADLYVRALGQSGSTTPGVDAVVVALPAPIDRFTGRVGSPSVLPGWSGVDVASEMARRLGRPVHVDNDANLAAQAERTLGAGREYTDFLYLEVSRGIGAGLVLRGDVYPGARGFAGELGHTQVDPGGPLCRCGQNGCAEVTVSSALIMDRLRQVHRLGTEDPRTLADFHDDVSARVLRDAGYTLGTVVAEVCNALNPQAVVVGGDVRTAHGAYREGLATAIRTLTQPLLASGVPVLPGQVPDAVAHGCLVRAQQLVFAHELRAEAAGRSLPRDKAHAVLWRGPTPGP